MWSKMAGLEAVVEGNIKFTAEIKHLRCYILTKGQYGAKGPNQASKQPIAIGHVWLPPTAEDERASPCRHADLPDSVVFLLIAGAGPQLEGDASSDQRQLCICHCWSCVARRAWNWQQRGLLGAALCAPLFLSCSLSAGRSSGGAMDKKTSKLHTRGSCIAGGNPSFNFQLFFRVARGICGRRVWCSKEHHRG